MQADQGQQQAVPPVPQIRLNVGTATVDDVRSALNAGLRDITKRPTLSLFFGLAYALIGASDIFLVVFNQQRRQFGWMALIVLFAFWLWAYQVRLMLALFLQNKPIQTFESAASVLFTTVEGATFLMVGSCVGAVLATLLFSLTVIAMPLLLDKDIDFVTAMITSVQTVKKSPVVMLGWGAVVGALTLVAVAPMLLGVIVIFPILGHASWHLYERLVSEG